MIFSERLQEILGKSLKDATNEEIYEALLNTVKEAAKEKGNNVSETGRKIYYISAEFLTNRNCSQYYLS